MVSDQNTGSNMIKITWTNLQDLSFSQQCWWRFQSPGGFDTFVGQVVPSASRAQQSFETSGTTHLMTQLKPRILHNTTKRTSNLTTCGSEEWLFYVEHNSSPQLKFKKFAFQLIMTLRPQFYNFNIWTHLQKTYMLMWPTYMNQHRTNYGD